MTDVATKLASRLERLENHLAIVLSVHLVVEHLLDRLIDEKSPIAKRILKDHRTYTFAVKLALSSVMDRTTECERLEGELARDEARLAEFARGSKSWGCGSSTDDGLASVHQALQGSEELFDVVEMEHLLSENCAEAIQPVWRRCSQAPWSM